MAFVLIAIGASSCADDNRPIRENKELLLQLDSLIAHHDEIIRHKEERISKIRNEFETAVSANRKIEASRALYHEYQVYNPDSALSYARMSTRLAQGLQPPDSNLVATCVMEQAFIYATQGFLQDAFSQLSTLNPDALPISLKIEYYQVAQFICSHQALFNCGAIDKSDPAIIKANAYRDSLVRLDPDGRNEVLWAPVAIRIDHEKYDPPTEAVKKLENAVQTSTEPTRDNAINAYWLAMHYNAVGNRTKAIRYMAMAAIYDAEIENREIAAATDLARWLFDMGDVERAYTYLVYSSDQANAYHNRTRVVNIGNVLPSVRDAYAQAIVNRDKRLRLSLWLLIALSVVLAISGGWNIIENRRIRRARRELAEMNRNLAASVAQRDEAIAALEHANNALSQSNNELSEANTVKQGLVTLSFRLNSDYINALDDYRKKLLRKFKLKQFVEIGAELGDQDLVRDLYKDFYVAFDHTILSIFPDFVAEYNASAPPDAQVAAEAIAKSRTLCTRLRIHALRRLGVEKSADIARMLNVSIRTVYNNRN